jgi:hypothetical protein
MDWWLHSISCRWIFDSSTANTGSDFAHYAFCALDFRQGMMLVPRITSDLHHSLRIKVAVWEFGLAEYLRFPVQLAWGF